MTKKEKNLSQNAADDIVAMITIDKKYSAGDKLPNENDLASMLKISRTTLREAIRILVAHDVLEIRRGKGTFVVAKDEDIEGFSLDDFSVSKLNAKDLYEMRLIFEPQTAYYAALRATDKELNRILHYGKLEEQKILNNEDRTELDQAFHRAIAKATHNEFMNKLMPILHKAIDKGVVLSDENKIVLEDTLIDHRMIMDFLQNRDAEGAKTAMKLHIIHAMRGLGINNE
jgi:DNA-binding FadR family transcriptional regulator